MNLRSTCVLMTVAGSLAACVVVPVDSRTGQPITHSTGVSYAPLPAVPPAPTTWSVRLYPLNDNANQIGMLNAIVIDQGGRGHARQRQPRGGQCLRRTGCQRAMRVHDQRRATRRRPVPVLRWRALPDALQ
jgi:hypothetical protein